MPVLNLFEAGGEYLKDTKEVRKEVTQDRAESYTRGYKKGLKKMKSSIMELEMERIGTMVCGFRISDNKMKSLITTLAYEGRSDAVQRDQGGQKVQTVVLPGLTIKSFVQSCVMLLMSIWQVLQILT